MGFDIRKVMDVLITDILAEGDVKTAKILQSVFARLGSQCYIVGYMVVRPINRVTFICLVSPYNLL